MALAAISTGRWPFRQSVRPAAYQSVNHWKRSVLTTESERSERADYHKHGVLTTIYKAYSRQTGELS